MAKIDYNIKIEYIWLREKTNLERCFLCGQTIYSDRYRLFLMPSSQNKKMRYKGNETNIFLCESCNNTVNT